MNEIVKTKALKSLVTVHHYKGGTGMGVLVDRNRIVTAAHCLPPLPSRRINPFLCDDYLVQVKQFGTKKWASCVLQSVDICSDIAVLSDGDLFDKQFESMQECMESAPVNLLKKDHGKKQPVHVFTHEGNWLSAELDLSQPWRTCRPFESIARASIYFDGEIKSGTSGSPVFDRRGSVIGVISQASVPRGEEKQQTTITVLTGALPRWIAAELTNSDL